MCARAIVLGCAIDRLDMAGTLKRCREAIDNRRYIQHVSINAAKLVSLRRQPALREVIERCGLVNADGQSVVWASRLLGDPLPERVAGIDLMKELMAMAEEHGYRIFILGARCEVLQAAVDTLRKQHPQLAIAGFHHGYFADEESPQIAAEIRATRSDILFVAMSSPRKERWLGEHGSTLDVPLVMGVGGSIDIVAGATKRAPTVCQQTGLEWLYRVGQEPRRLAGRYILSNAHFISLVLQAMAQRIWHRACR
jgi:N-acetylglucosaminyldiphosphoundecaprenol N-acetyl-beta-D-mannosaminyltransferase